MREQCRQLPDRRVGPLAGETSRMVLAYWKWRGTVTFSLEPSPLWSSSVSTLPDHTNIQFDRQFFISILFFIFFTKIAKIQLKSSSESFGLLCSNLDFLVKCYNYIFCFQFACRCAYAILAWNKSINTQRRFTEIHACTDLPGEGTRREPKAREEWRWRRRPNHPCPSLRASGCV